MAGGVVNFITKKPQAEESVNFDIQFGSYGFIRPIVGATGALDDDGRVLFRVDADYQHNDSFRDFGIGERTFVAPSFTWLIDDDDTALTLEGAYQNDRTRFDTGVTALNGAIDPIPISRFLNEPTDFSRYQNYKSAFFLTHKFEGDWTGRIGGFATWYDNPFVVNAPVVNLGVPLAPGFPPLAPPGMIGRELEVTPDNKEQNYSIIIDLGGTVHMGQIEDKMLVGTELGYYNTFFKGQLSDPLAPQMTPFGFFPVSSDPISINNPMYGAPSPAFSGSILAAIQQQRYGFYAEDLADWQGTIKLLAGVRGDIVDTAFQRSLNSTFGGQQIGFPEVDSDETDYRITPRVGLVYQPIKDVLSFYTTYSLSFDPPTTSIFRNPMPLKPETGRIIEAGVKADLLDKHLTVTADGYYIITNNVVTQDTSLFATQIGEQRSQGAELSATGRLTDEWSIVANYAYTDSRIRQSVDPTQVGVRFRGIPYNNVNLWTRYDVIHTKEQALGAGIGIVAMDNRIGKLPSAGDPTNFELPGYTRWDAGLFYNRGPWNVSFYFENILDKHYYAGSVDEFTVFPGEPFTVRGTVGVKF